MVRPVRNVLRLLAVAWVMAREDALFVLHELRVPVLLLWPMELVRRRRPQLRPGIRLANALTRLGPSFIKLGQAMSTRADLLGDDVAGDLAHLRDSLPPFPAHLARAIIETELDCKLGERFAQFDDRPVAAASIAQVHRARTHGGREVAVKVLRPGIEGAFARDLELFDWLAALIDRYHPAALRLKPVQVARTVREAVFMELDLRFEAAAAAELADNLARHEPGLRAPEIDWGLTARRVMTMEWIDGVPVSDIDALRAAGHDTDAILAKAARSLFAQVFMDGFFHADLHPGNLFVDAEGNLVAVDFGIMGRLDWRSRLYMAEILRGFMTRDYRRVAEVHFEAGYVPAHKSLDSFAQACMAVGRPIADKPLNEISVARLLAQMFAIAGEFEMQTQPQLLLLQKTMMVAEGVGRMLNPALNMWELAGPLIEQWSREHLGVQGRARDTARRSRDLLRKLPRQIEVALETLGDPQGVRIHSDSLRVIAANASAWRARPAAWRFWLFTIAFLLAYGAWRLSD